MHYVSVPIIKSRYDHKFCQRGGCIVSKKDLKPGKTEKQQVLKFMIHLIAHFHKPEQYKILDYSSYEIIPDDFHSGGAILPALLNGESPSFQFLSIGS